MKKIIFLMLFTLVGWQNAQALGFINNGINYRVTSSNTVSVGYQNQAVIGVIVIPAQVTNNNVVYSVTTIDGSAFSVCSALTSVTIPNSVISIGEGAFYGCCSGLTSVINPSSVTSLSSYAFTGCSGLTSVTIPNSVTSITAQTFASCSGLTSITIPNTITIIGDYAFAYCCFGLTTVTVEWTTPITISDNVFQNSNSNYIAAGWGGTIGAQLPIITLDSHLLLNINL